MIKKLILTLIVFFTILVGINVNAECTKEEIDKMNLYGTNVKASYNLIDNSVKKTATEDGLSRNYIIPNFAFNITVYNIMDSLYVKISNNINSEIINIKNSDTTNNMYTFVNSDFVNAYNYKLDVYYSSPGCGEKKIKTINISKPRYNVYSETDICQESDANICKKFLTTNEDFTYDDFIERMNQETLNVNEVKSSVVQNFLKNNGKRLSIIIVLLTFVVVLIVIVRHRITSNKMKKGGWKI